jgi:alpha-D-xyloside xylohydrolase
MQAAGIPWWTYDAGGFFRPGNQYQDAAYIERMLRWIETSVYLPLMRVHGYMSNTEPWNYGTEAQQIIAGCLKERYRLLPYIYSNAASVAFDGGTLMRPFVFDFADDATALQQKCDYMFGRALLVSPVTEAGVSQWTTYLPKNAGGWYDQRSNRHYEGGQRVTTAVDKSQIPVFVRAGSIIPMAGDTLCVYPGADASFTLYEDDGETFAYEQKKYTKIPLKWDDRRHSLTVGARTGNYAPVIRRTFTVVLPDGRSQTVSYSGRPVTKVIN